ncbi:MAG: hypothetical protein VXZ72_03625 [Chlamydiota bacterium]|nr:hypothetical protein [Chlamydiota bacterium]
MKWWPVFLFPIVAAVCTYITIQQRYRSLLLHQAYCHDQAHLQKLNISNQEIESKIMEYYSAPALLEALEGPHHALHFPSHHEIIRIG